MEGRRTCSNVKLQPRAAAIKESKMELVGRRYCKAVRVKFDRNACKIDGDDAVLRGKQQRGATKSE